MLQARGHYGTDDPREALCDVDAELRDHTTQAIDQLPALADKQSPCAMERQQSLLFSCLYGNKPHSAPLNDPPDRSIRQRGSALIRTRDCFTNGLGSNGVGLPAFDVWFDIHRWDQAHIMA